MSAVSSLSAAAISTPSSSYSSSSATAATSSIDHFSLTSIHFSLRVIKPIKCSNHKTHYHLNFHPLNLASRSLIFCASDAFDGAEAIQDEGLLEEEEEEEVVSQEEEEEEEEENDEAVGVSQPAEARRLYVGNLPYSMTSSQLADVFAEAGRVASVEIVYDRVTDRSRGFAFVTMGSVEEAKEAIRLFDGSQVGGRTVKVNFPEVPRGGEREVMGQKIRNSNQGYVDSPHKIYAGNLSWGLTSQGLREAFEDHPGFLSAKVIYDRDSGRSRGFGFVSFASAEEVESTLNAMNGVEVEGRPLRLNLAEQRSPVSPPPELETDSETETESSEMFSGVST